MKPGVSSLNPYAEAYVPLCKREAYDRTECTINDSKTGNETAWYTNPIHETQNQHQSKVSLASVAPGDEKGPIPEQSSVKYHPIHDSYGSSSSKQMMDEENDMEMAYLQMTFPGLSDQSLADVYMANKCDLEATIDMLNQLEFDAVESSENLPDSLDIGDVPEYRASSESASLKLKNVVGEASSSSSGSSGPAIPPE
ncbi:polyadenylate-binding protein-interacting protein 6-like [Mangifera indica]|uniref:polyadenylate-binding protein-interacting protein 6-like n=1 Tax=Mangifera indica TaxID=29780 RepID=UPI001CFBAB2B|nr:polyadenylate-binding protein-interacting protein 6-like [Mangifera indica]XP_044472573.1 polyadenylate-binding protein-interacting protein 6-like [Mangifera indica]